MQAIQITQAENNYQNRLHKDFYIFLIPFVFILFFLMLGKLGLGIEFLYVIIFFFFILMIKYYQFVKRNRYYFLSLSSDESGIQLSYMNKNDRFSKFISWQDIQISTGSIFSKSAKFVINIYEKENLIGQFYSDINLNYIDLRQLYNQLLTLKKYHHS